MPNANLNGFQLHYEQVGQGPDVVLLHGLAANLAFWYFSIVPMLARQFRTTVFDLRGHGYSDMPLAGYKPGEMAKDLLALLDYLEIGRAHLVGHSFGGLIALHFAAQYPERAASLTIADSRIGALQPKQRFQDWPYWKPWSRRLERLGIYLDGEQDLTFGLFELMAHRALQGRRREHGGTLPFLPFETWNGGRRTAERWLQLLRNTTAREDIQASDGLTREKIHCIEQPAQIVYGERSFCVPSGIGLKQTLPHNKLTIVPEAGHFFPVLMPRLFALYLLEFLPTNR
jgi:pimeloyl-ACP methyl ester carboxylesterase